MDFGAYIQVTIGRVHLNFIRFQRSTTVAVNNFTVQPVYALNLFYPCLPRCVCELLPRMTALDSNENFIHQCLSTTMSSRFVVCKSSVVNAPHSLQRYVSPGRRRICVPQFGQSRYLGACGTPSIASTHISVSNSMS